MFGSKSKNLGEELKATRARVAELEARLAEAKTAAEAADAAKAGIEARAQEAEGKAAAAEAKAAELEAKLAEALASDSDSKLAAALDEIKLLKGKLEKPAAAVADAVDGEATPCNTDPAAGETFGWAEAVARCGGNYAEARERFPEAYKATYPNLARN